MMLRSIPIPLKFLAALAALMALWTLDSAAQDLRTNVRPVRDGQPVVDLVKDPALDESLARSTPTKIARAVPSDQAALAWIFSEQHIVESGASVCQHAATLNPADRYNFLRSWVLPSSSHSRCRITADFTATDGESQLPPALVSPVRELIQAAGELNVLDSLRQQITTAGSISGDPIAVCDRLILLALIALEQRDTQALEKYVDELLGVVRPDKTLLAHARSGILLLADGASRSRPSSQAIGELVLFTTLAYQAEYERPVWLRHLVAAEAKLNDASETTDAAIRPKSQWFMASRERAFEHGNAFPYPRPALDRGSYRNRSNYGDDLLFYQSPLQGDFTIDALATGFGYHEAHLMVGGFWTGLVFTHTQSMLGNMREELSRPNLATPLTDTHRYGYLRTRVSTRNGIATTSINGRDIHQQPIGDTAYPWIAIRTNYRVQGGVDNLRITGDPVIPDRIAMVESPDLLGWYDYYQAPGDGPNPLSNWKASVDSDAQPDVVTEIVDPQINHVPRGSHVEHLLRYARPIVEDGVIEYEFWYESEKWMAHPAVGRTCFLLREGGVSEHRLTDGQFDRSGRRPDNEQAIDTDDRPPLPLRPNAWNEMQMQRQGDQITLRLNGQAIHTSTIEPTALLPCFGLFHFADQTSLRVRNPRWTGDWPKKLPATHDQQLAGDFAHKLDWTATDPGQEMSLRLDSTSISNGQLRLVEGDPTKTMAATNQGLVLSQVSETSYRGTLMAPVVEVGGDFDVTVSYDQFDFVTRAEKTANVRLEVTANTPAIDLALVQRIVDRTGGQQVQCLRMATTNGNQRRTYFGPAPCDTDAGRLRLSRRGDKIYYLAADGDSDYFYLLGEDSFASEDLRPLGIQFGVQIQGPGGRVGARFTKMAVRAERVTGNLANDQPTTLDAEGIVQSPPLPAMNDLPDMRNRPGPVQPKSLPTQIYDSFRNLFR